MKDKGMLSKKKAPAGEDGEVKKVKDKVKKVKGKVKSKKDEASNGEKDKKKKQKKTKKKKEKEKKKGKAKEASAKKKAKKRGNSDTDGPKSPQLEKVKKRKIESEVDSTGTETKTSCDGPLHVFVSNLDWNVTEADVLGFFPGISAINWLLDKRGKFKGRVILKLESNKFGSDALGKSGESLLDRPVTVAPAKEELMKKGKFENVLSPSTSDGLSTERINMDHAESSEVNSVFVSNLPFTAVESIIKSFFDNAEEVALVRDRRGKFKGRAIVHFGDSASKLKALARNGEEYEGRVLAVAPVKEELLKDKSYSRKNQKNGDDVKISEDEGVSSVFVSNLPFTADEQSVQSFFSADSVVLVKDRRGKFKGRAIVHFRSSKNASEAIGRSGEEFEGRAITVTEVKQELLKEKYVQPPMRAQKDTVVRSGGSRKPNISSKPEGCNVIFIAGLNEKIEDEHIHDLFKECGTITEIRWIFDRVTKQFKQCGCVEFENEDSVDLAMEKAGEDVLGRPIRISYAQPKQSRQSRR